MKGISSSARNTVILVSALIIAVLFAVYYYLVLPKKQEVETAQSTIASLNTEISSTQNQIFVLQDEEKQVLENLFALRQRVPATRDIESLIRHIEEVESITGTRVESIAFNNYDTQVSGAGLVDPNAPATQEGQAATTTTGQTTTNATTPAATGGQATEGTPANGGTATSGTQEATGATQGTTAEGAVPVATIAPESLPPELKMITLSVNVLSPDYDTLQEFIKEFEHMDRVVKVDTFSFSLPGEADVIADNPKLEISSTIQITTFYYVGE